MEGEHAPVQEHEEVIDETDAEEAVAVDGLEDANENDSDESYEVEHARMYVCHRCPF